MRKSYLIPRFIWAMGLDGVCKGSCLGRYPLCLGAWCLLVLVWLGSLYQKGYLFFCSRAPLTGLYRYMAWILALHVFLP